MTELQHLLVILDQAYDHRSWHGTNLRGSIRGLSPEQAAWRPAQGRHNIWELVVHSAYWKYVARRRLTGGTRHSFPLAGSNWFERPIETTGKAWRSDIGLLDDMHRSLRATIADLPPSTLHRRNGRGQRHELLAHRRRGRARSLSCGSDSAAEEAQVGEGDEIRAKG